MDHTDKIQVQQLVYVLRKLGLEHVVVSPGSRSAPLVQEFNAYPEIKKHVLFDERCAGYVALGLAQQFRKPVAVFCTSGTAVLNLAPAICETYYQKIPLIILTSDRPADVIGKGENQAINQIDIYQNYIKAFLNYEEGTGVEQLVEVLVQSMSLAFGPVHINIPLTEPLYNKAEFNPVTLPIIQIPTSPALSKQARVDIAEQWKAAKRKLIICGIDHAQSSKSSWLKLINAQEDVVVLHEPVSNIWLENSIHNIDGTLAAIKDAEAFQPDLVLTVGKQFTSKRLRQFLKKANGLRHWHVSIENEAWDSFGQLETIWQCTDSDLLRAISAVKGEVSDWKKNWLNQQAAVKPAESPSEQLTDMEVYTSLATEIKENTIIQWGNSSPVRYSSLFTYAKGVEHFANRGTSGIDGCVSTAVGCALANPDKDVLLIVGDISFFYDSNALFYKPFPKNLKIIIINNGGGNIFRLIEGQQDETLMQQFFETRHSHSAEHLAEMFSLRYLGCEKKQLLEKAIADFFAVDNSCILELKTDATASVATYKNYFKNE